SQRWEGACSRQCWMVSQGQGAQPAPPLSSGTRKQGKASLKGICCQGDPSAPAANSRWASLARWCAKPDALQGEKSNGAPAKCLVEVVWPRRVGASRTREQAVGAMSGEALGRPKCCVMAGTP